MHCHPAWHGPGSEFSKGVSCYLAEITEHTTNTLDRECRSTEYGESYTGHVNYTLSGIPCQRWDDKSPHSHGYDDITWFADYKINPNVSIKMIDNYCRNPSVLSTYNIRPWCFTTSYLISTEYCDIPRCKSKCAIYDMV